MYKLILLLSLFSSTALAVDTPKLDADVIIIGAGLSGLSTAYRLKKEGFTSKIVELSPHLGGRMRTANYPGDLSAEVGLEEFWEGNPTLEIAKELKVPMEKSASSFSTYLYEGKQYSFTQETNSEFIASIFSKRELESYHQWDQHMAELYQKTQIKPLSKELLKLKDISFGDWVQKQSKLPKKIQEFIRIESEPEYATSWKNISALDGILEWHIFSGEGTGSSHTVGGNQVLAEKIADDIGKKNIVMNTKVTRVESTDQGVTVDAVDQGNYQHQTYHGRYVVSTPPLFRLGEIQFIPPLSPERRTAIQTQSWGAYFTAHVILNGEAMKFFTVAGENILPILSDTPLGVIYGDFEPKKKPSQILLNLLITGADAERFNLRAVIAMDSVRAELTQVMEKQFPGSAKMIQKMEFYQYHPRAIASWPVGRSRLDDPSNLLRQPQGRVYLAGDFTEGTHSDGAAQSAVRVVNDIVKRGKK